MGDYKVAIIGGGPAGMMAAIRAAQVLGPHEVCILEKNDQLGRNCLPFLKRKALTFTLKIKKESFQILKAQRMCWMF